MLDLLDLATEPQKSKSSQKQSSRQQLFALILLRLKQRNNLNQAIINKFVKQTLRKKNKVVKMLNCVVQTQRQGVSFDIEDYRSTNSIKYFSKLRRPQQCQGSLTILGEEKGNPIECKQTNHTEETIDEGKANSLPIINYLQLSKQGSQIMRRMVQKGSRPSLNCNKQMRNQIGQEGTLQETSIPRKGISKQAQLKKSPRMHNKNDINKGKVQVNIKTFAFASEQIVFHKKMATETIQSSSLCYNQNDRFRFSRKYETIEDLQGSIQKTKAFLPTIKKQYRVLNTNRKYLINHIRNTNERMTFDEIDVFRNCQINFEILTSKYGKGRNISSFQANSPDIKTNLD